MTLCPLKNILLWCRELGGNGFLGKKLNLAQETFLGGVGGKVPNAFRCLIFNKDGMDSGLSRRRWILALPADQSLLPDMIGMSPFFCSRLTLLPGLQVLPLLDDFLCLLSQFLTLCCILTFASILFALQPNTPAKHPNSLAVADMP